jgi:hypothetical protein
VYLKRLRLFDAIVKVADSNIGDFLKCTECSSSKLRLSRFRLKDVKKLLRFQYPIRCRRCNRRQYVGLRQILLHAWKVRCYLWSSFEKR